VVEPPRQNEREANVPLWFRVARIWIPVTVAFTVACGLCYLSVQQSYRNGLDDPQLQLATDAAAALDAGAPPASVVTSPVVDAEKSLKPFVSVFARNDSVLVSGGSIAGGPAAPPSGVLEAARSASTRTNRVTWQPAGGVRVATVEAASQNGLVVVAGRNMRAVETRIGNLGEIVALAWGLGVAATLVAVTALEFAGLRMRS
jgi:hypothetical protein